MAGGIGAQGHLGLRKEASFASGGAVDNWQPVNNASLNLTYANIYSDRVRNTEEQVGGMRGHEAVTGSIVFPVTPRGPLQWWVCGLGQASSPYSIARPLSSMLFQLDQEQECIQASGCMIGSMTLSSASGGELTCSADVEGKGLSDVTAGTPSYTASDDPYLHEDATFSLNGSTVTNITSWSITIANSLITDLWGNQRLRLDIPAGKLVVTGTFTKLFNDSAEYNGFLQQGVRSFQVTFNKGARQFDVNVAKLRYNDRPSEVTGQSEYIMETFSWTGFVDDPATEKSVVVTVTQ